MNGCSEMSTSQNLSKLGWLNGYWWNFRIEFSALFVLWTKWQDVDYCFRSINSVNQDYQRLRSLYSKSLAQYQECSATVSFVALNI